MKVGITSLLFLFDSRHQQIGRARENSSPFFHTPLLSRLITHEQQIPLHRKILRFTSGWLFIPLIPLRIFPDGYKLIPEPPKNNYTEVEDMFAVLFSTFPCKLLIPSPLSLCDSPRLRSLLSTRCMMSSNSTSFENTHKLNVCILTKSLSSLRKS